MQVPKQARLSALRVEIAVLNKDLPAEVDIPLLLSSHPFPNQIKDLPAKQNRVVRIVPSEAVLLNSAERIPYLLLVEYLHNDIDFDPLSEQIGRSLPMNSIVNTFLIPGLGQRLISILCQSLLLSGILRILVFKDSERHPAIPQKNLHTIPKISRTLFLKKYFPLMKKATLEKYLPSTYLRPKLI